MSHIDDGTIHAYLDGALDSYPAVEAAKIREHLESCDECARRLDEERVIRGEAEAILAMSAPIVQMPPLEDLRALAARRKEGSKARGLSRMNRWSWAASVVLALGTGWMLRGGTSGMISRPSVQEKAAQPSVLTPVVGGQVDAAATDVPSGSDQELASEPGSEPGSDSRQALEDGPVLDLDEAASLETQGGGGAQVPSPEEEVAEAPAQPIEAALPAAQERVDPADSISRMRQAEKRPSLVSADEVARAQRSTVEGMAAPSPEVVQLESRVVEDSSGEPLFRSELGTVQKLSEVLGDTGTRVVPGLSVVDVAWAEDAGIAGVMRVRQVMENGDTLEIMHLPAGSDPSDLERRPADTRTELVAQDGGGWVVLWAHADRERLADYLRLMMGG